jgi:hypothetical protein
VGRTFDVLGDALECVATNAGARLLRYIGDDTWAQLESVGTYYVPGSDEQVKADDASPIRCSA